MEPAFCTTPQRLLRTDELDRESLELFLFSDDYPCLIIEDAVDALPAGHVVRRITNSQHLSGYAVEPRFLKIGRAWFDCATEEERAAHIANTIRYSKETSALCRPFPVPTDTLKLELDLIWGPGVMNQRIDGRPIYYGLPRALPPGGAVEAHFDWIGFDSPGALGIEHIQRQIAVNVHLQTAEQGGELALWDVDLSPAELMALRLTGQPYALDEEKLGAPTVVVKPPERSLVLFDATKPHAVRKTGGNRPRVTFSSFMGYAGADMPLTLWS